MPPLTTKQGILPAIAWKLLEYAPLPAEAAMDRLHHIFSSIAHWRIPVTRFTGTHPVTGTATSVIVADNQPSVEYFSRHILGSDFKMENLGHIAAWNLPRFFAHSGSDATLCIARVDRSLGRLLFTGKQLHVPECIGTCLTVPEDGDVTTRARHSQASNLRLIRKNGLSWEIGRNLKEFDYFYHNMYVPFTLERHGDAALIRSYARLRNYMLHGGIIWVLHNGHRISGDLFAEAGDTLYWICTGTEQENEDPVALGATSSICLFGAQYAKQARLRLIDLGLCRPSLRDGLLVHKKRWGAELRNSARCRHSLVFHWENWSDEIAHFLWHTAPIARERDGLTGIVALPDRESGTETLQKELLVPGIRRLKVLDGEAPVSVRNRERA